MRFTMRSRLSRSFAALGRVDIVSFECGPVMRRKVDGRWSLVVSERRDLPRLPNDQRLPTNDCFTSTVRIRARLQACRKCHVMTAPLGAGAAIGIEPQASQASALFPERPATNDQRLTTNDRRLPHRPLFDPLLKLLALKNPFPEHA